MKISEVRRHALSLADVSEEPHFNFSSFRVRGKIFVTVPPDEEHIHVFVPEEERERALALYADFLEKLFWGKKVLGLRVTLGAAKPAVVKQLIERAWHYKIPQPRKATAKRSSRKA